MSGAAADDDFDDIFGESVQTSPLPPAPRAAPGRRGGGGGGGAGAGDDGDDDDELDALFGVASPGSATKHAVREAMESTKAPATPPDASAAGTAAAAAAAASAASEDDFSDIFGDSPAGKGVSSDIIAAFQAANADLDGLLSASSSSSSTSSSSAAAATASRPERVFSLSDDEDEDITEFVVSDFLPSSAAVLDDLGGVSPLTSPRNASSSSPFGAAAAAVATATADPIRLSLSEKELAEADGAHSGDDDDNDDGGDDGNGDRGPAPALPEREEPAVPAALARRSEPIGAATEALARDVVRKARARSGSSAAPSVGPQAPSPMYGRTPVVRADAPDDECATLARAVREALALPLEEREAAVRSACLALLLAGRAVPEALRPKVWALLLGVESTGPDGAERRDHTLENTMLVAAETAQVHGVETLRSECAAASTWAAEVASAEGGNADSIASDMDLLVTFFTANSGVDYVPGVAWLTAPFYAAGMAQTTTVYKCLRALCGALLPAAVGAAEVCAADAADDSAAATADRKPKKPSADADPMWMRMACHAFGLLVRYHDPELASHLGLCEHASPQRRRIVPLSWLFGGFAGPSPRLPARELLRLWDWIIVEADPCFPWMCSLALLLPRRDVLLAEPSALAGGSITEQSAAAKRLATTVVRLGLEGLPGIDGGGDEGGGGGDMNTVIRRARTYCAATPPSFRAVSVARVELAQKSSGGRVGGRVGGRRSSYSDIITWPTSSAEWYERALDFYLVHNRSKIMNLPGLLDQFRGVERKLVRRIETKYYPLRVHGKHRALAQRCARIQPAEIVPHLFSLGGGRRSGVTFFVVDCRPPAETSCGRFGSAWPMAPMDLAAALRDDSAAAREARRGLLEPLDALKGQRHVCVLGSGRNRLLECISTEEATRYAVEEMNRVRRCVSLFVQHGGYPFVSVIAGGFDACFDQIQRTAGAALGELVDYDPERCRPSRYHRYRKLEATRPKAALVLKSYALKTIRERRERVAKGLPPITRLAKPTLSTSSTSAASSRRTWNSQSRHQQSKAAAAADGGGSGRGGSSGLSKFGKFFKRRDSGSSRVGEPVARRRSWSSGSEASDSGAAAATGCGGDEDDPVESAIIAAMQAVRKEKEADNKKKSSRWAAVRSFGSHFGKQMNKAVTNLKTEYTKAREDAQQYNKNNRNGGAGGGGGGGGRYSTGTPKQRRNSDPPQSRRQSTDSLSFATPATGRVAGQDNGEDDDLVDAPAWDEFAEPSPAAVEEQQNAEEEEPSAYPIDLTRQGAVDSLGQLCAGDGLVESDFIGTVNRFGEAAPAWFSCEFIPPEDAEEEEWGGMRRRTSLTRRTRGWKSSEHALLCERHCVVVRVYRRAGPSRQQIAMKKAREATKMAAKRFGKWVSRLKTPSSSSSAGDGGGEGGGGGRARAPSSSSSMGTMVVGDSPAISEADIAGEGPADANVDLAGEDGQEQAVEMPALVQVQFVADITKITRMTRKKNDPDVLSLYFGEDGLLTCAFDDPSAVIKQFKTRCSALKKAGLIKSPPASRKLRKGSAAAAAASASPASAEDTPPAVPSKRPSLDMGRLSRNNAPDSPPISPATMSPRATKKAFTLDESESDESDEESEFAASPSPTPVAAASAGAADAAEANPFDLF